MADVDKIEHLNVPVIIDKSKSLNEGAILFPTFQPGSYRWHRYANSGYFDPDKKLKNYSNKEWEMLLNAPEHKPKAPGKGWGKTSFPLYFDYRKVKFG